MTPIPSRKCPGQGPGDPEVTVREVLGLRAEGHGGLRVLHDRGRLAGRQEDPALVAKAKANTDSDFNADNTVVTDVLSKFIDRREKSEEIINALLKGQNMETFANLLALIGFRDYLARVDYMYPSEPVHVEVTNEPLTPKGQAATVESTSRSR